MSTGRELTKSLKSVWYTSHQVRHEHATYAAFLDFYDHEYDRVYEEVKNASGLKLRISLTGRLAEAGMADIIRKLYPVADKLVLAPAVGLWCSAMHESRLHDMTSYGELGVSMPKQPDRLVVHAPFQLELPDFLTIEGEAMVSAGELYYLPRDHQLNVPTENPYLFQGTPVDGQLWKIARDVDLSGHLGCTHVFPKLMSGPVGITPAAVPDAVAFALARLRFPYLESCSLETMVHIKAEEYGSFKALQKAIIDCIAELQLANQGDSDIVSTVSRIQKEILDYPIASLPFNCRRPNRDRVIAPKPIPSTPSASAAYLIPMTRRLFPAG